MSKSLYQTNVESRAPLTTDTGVVGNWWVDTSASPADLYLCTDATGGVYTWTKQGGSGGGVQQDTSATNIATLLTALTTLQTAGKQILSIEFTPTSTITNNQYRALTTTPTSPSFTVTQESRNIFNQSEKAVLTFSAYQNERFIFTCYSPTDNTNMGYVFINIPSESVNYKASSTLVETAAGVTNIVLYCNSGNIKTKLNNSVNAYTINYI